MDNRNTENLLPEFDTYNEVKNIQSCKNCRWLDDDGDRLACFAPNRILRYVYKWNWCEKWEGE